MAASTVRAWRIHECGGADRLRLDSLPSPEPKADEVRVRIRACGLNRSDLLWITGAFFQPQLPARVGYEICGLVEAVGSAVRDFKPGDRVSNLPTFYIGDYGNFADAAVMPAACLVHTPPQLSDTQAAAGFFVYLTGYLALVELARLRPYQVLLVTAAASANGMTAIALARKLGATVIATTRSAAKRKLLLEAGAQHVVVTGEEDLAARVAEITKGAGAEVIYDCVGGGLTPALLNSIAPRGLWIQYGFLDPSPVEVCWPQWMQRQPRLVFFSVPQYAGLKQMGFAGEPEAIERARRFIAAGFADRSLPIPIAREFRGIESVPDAFRALDANLGGGKIVVSFA